MQNHWKPVLVVVTLGTLALALPVSDSVAQPARQPAPEKPREKRTAEEKDDADTGVLRFMRRKLVSSQSVLEGLVVEDFDMIAKGAKQMEAMSLAAEWQTIKDPLYVQFSNGFRQACEDLGEAAKEENVDAAGLAYMRLTMGCITCHHYVRKTRMAGLPIAPDGHGLANRN